ncbi:hypothetical protein K488DRAFT_88840 [Vararia minispora EC-137]|uniref:Uncharacterized protein n=1 Tax=Vararia minispora EC-137 TaxID=1314806 RepID=A0ACB8QC85_9AGAM|nr:hypothetical protein K488DRAFT_88840 [Vararia minispora EC-137]
MPLASSGALLSVGREAFASMRSVPNGSRAFHQLYNRPTQTTSTAQRLLRQTRNLIQAFVGHLTTPGTLGRQAPSRSLHHLTRGQTIQSGLSLHVRHALSQPLGAPKLPRPPTVPRSVFQVGLGTARKFSTGRPIFAHLVENVPVAGRAFVEADWDLRLQEEKGRFMKENAKKQKKQKKVKAEKITICTVPTAEADAPIEVNASEFERYFPTTTAPAPVPGVTTTLLIPLAPTPSSRLPLPALPKSSAPDAHPLVPFAELSSLHYDFARHNERVAALFARLDAADVWSAGARCDAYGDTTGGANVLRVAFAGWDALRVRGIIGEIGSGWCVLEEEREMDDAEMDAALEALDRVDSPLPGSRPLSPLSPLRTSPVSFPSTALDMPPALADFGVSIDPAQSFVLPTLDFSSTFEASSGYAMDMGSSESEFDYFSDHDSLSSSGSGSATWIEPPSVTVANELPAGSWLGFSSAFATRMENGPMEEMF